MNSYAWSARPIRLDMSSVADGRTHTINAEEFDKGVWQNTGRYRAICGADVVAAALASVPGPRCPTCRQRHHDDEPPPVAVRLARPTWLPWPLHLSRGAS